ncbi:MAG: right-handed parallel beta-helix repeat-containing protein, partial [Chloroflexota bacterium]|nr:right-handed parallel beta-helix repeat-containing protein [Chloroflexota bacterium]
MNGVWPLNSRTVTATAILTATDSQIYLDASAGPFTITLPSPVAGRAIVLERTDASANVVTIAGTATALTLSATHGKTLTSDGTAWYLAGRAEPNGTYVQMVTGLDATGATNASVIIQAALDAAFAAGGGEVILPRGIFRINTSLIIRSGVTLRGTGRGKTILRPPTGTIGSVTVNGAFIGCCVAMVGAVKAAVLGLTVDLTTNSAGANGIAMMPEGAAYNGTRTTDSTVQDCEVLGNGNAQYCIWNLRGQRNKILFNYVNGGSVASNTQEGIEVFGGDDILVMGNTVRNVGSHGIYSNSAGGVAATDRLAVRVIDNTVDTADVGLEFDADAADGSLKNSTVRGNTVTNMRTAGVSIACTATGVIRNLEVA